MNHGTHLPPGLRVLDAVGAMFGADNRGTVRRLSGETHAWVKWDDADGPLDLVHVDDLDVIS